MNPRTRRDAVTEEEGGWFGASGSDDPKDPPKRLFRSKEEADAADSLYKIANKPAPKK